MWPTARRLAMALTAILAVGVAQPAFACSSPGLVSAAEQLEDFALAFRGRAIRTLSSETGPPLDRGYVTEFEVIETLKGQPVEIQWIGHGPTILCGVSFELGQEYLVFAWDYDGWLYTSGWARPQFPIAEYREALATD